MKKKWSITLLTLLNVILVTILILRYRDHVETHHLMQKIAIVPFSLIASLVTLNLTVMLSYGARISLLINESLQVGFGIAATGYAANNLLPFRLGELFRIYFSKKKYEVSPSRSLVAIFFERMVDLFSLGCLTLIVVIGSINQLPINKSQIAFGIISPFVLIVIMIFHRDFWMKKFHGNFLYIRYIQPIITENKNLLSLKKLTALLKYTVLIWGVTVFSFFTFFRWSLPAAHFSLLDGICLSICTSLSLAISILPSSIGLFEGGIVYYLHSIKNIDETTSLALALIFHLLVLVPQILCMFYFLVSRNRGTSQAMELVNLQEQT